LHFSKQKMIITIPFILLVLTIISWFIALPKLFAKANENSTSGYVPVWQFITWQKITERPWWWILILIVPGVNFLMLIIMHVQLTWSFGHRDAKSTALAVVAPFYQLPKMAFDKETVYTGNIDWNVTEKGTGREWGDAILFALIAAFIIRTFTFEAFTIPTPSMEESMLVGDYLFVNKLKYGTRVPNTPISFPLAHHTMPVIGTKAYLEWMKLPYMRLPGWADVGRGDAVVFNFPEGDTVIVNQQNVSFYAERRKMAFRNAQSNEAKFDANPWKYLKQAQRELENRPGGLVVRPTDKKENYVKRCVGIAGDNLEIIDRVLHIDGKPQTQYKDIQFLYLVEFNKTFTNKMKEDLKDNLGINYEDRAQASGNNSIYFLTEKQVTELGQRNFVNKITPFDTGGENFRAVFPNVKGNTWTKDNYGPIYIPKRGDNLPLTKENIDLYERCITAYEGNEMTRKDGKTYINGVVADTYTFKMNYYWLMGDNRHNSLDSRYWGLVPEDHVVGQASFIWFSRDKEKGMTEKGGIRWNRIFTGVK